MIELTSTRANPLIDPTLAIWGSEVAVYLFLGGITAGIMVLSGMYYFLKGVPERCPVFICNAMLSTPILLTVGMFFLFLDLENKENVWRFYTTFQITSPMSWGSWILLIIYPATIVMTVVANRRRWWVNWHPAIEAKVTPYWRSIALANVVAGVALGLYTGILLSAFIARPFWNSGIIAPLFLISGISTGGAWMILFHDGTDIEEVKELGMIKMGLIVSEVLVILLFVSSMLTSAGNQFESIHLILGGPYTAQFWVFVVGIGLVVPMILQYLELQGEAESRFFMPLMVLVGGFWLRYIFVMAGQGIGT